MLRKVHIENYRVFRTFDLDFNDGLNVLVGQNDAGKTSVLEAVHLALTGRLRGRKIASELNPHLINREAADEYLKSLEAGESPAPPEIVIDLYLEEREETAPLRGSNNSAMEDAIGLQLKLVFSSDFAEEYERYVTEADEYRLVPTEYYTDEWRSFAGGTVTARSVPVTTSLIDATSIRLQSGADRFVEQLINQFLEPRERVDLARAYRTLREQFADDDAIKTINEGLTKGQQEVTEKELSLSIDVSHRTSWESNLVPHLDDLPFQYVGSGGQTVLKILLALERALEDTCHVVLLEEPENHQSPGSLNTLVREIAERCTNTQVLATTHSSFVLNKLGLDRLVLLGATGGLRLTDLPDDTLRYFKKLPGYDTLRIVLSHESILVEGPSDELIVQRAFREKHGALPSEKGIEVITTRGLSFKRFLQIAEPLGKHVTVITDNDGRDPDEVRAEYADFTAGGEIEIWVGDIQGGNTLEPQLVAANGIARMNEFLGTSHTTADEVVAFMTREKTEAALRIFASQLDVRFPEYIWDAV